VVKRLEPVFILKTTVLAENFPPLFVKKACKASAFLRFFALIGEKFSRQSGISHL